MEIIGWLFLLGLSIYITVGWLGVIILTHGFTGITKRDLLLFVLTSSIPICLWWRVYSYAPFEIVSKGGF